MDGFCALSVLFDDRISAVYSCTMRSLAVLPAEAEAAALAERLEVHAAQLMALARRVREAIRDCSAQAATEPIAPLPERLGDRAQSLCCRLRSSTTSGARRRACGHVLCRALG